SNTNLTGSTDSWGYTMAADTVVTREKLMQDVKIVISDAEELLRATASQAGEKVSAAREKVQESLHQAKVKLAEAEDVLIDKGKQAAKVTDEYVHDHPWRAVGIAAGIGLLIGLLIGRRLGGARPPRADGAPRSRR